MVKVIATFFAWPRVEHGEITWYRNPCKRQKFVFWGVDWTISSRVSVEQVWIRVEGGLATGISIAALLLQMVWIYWPIKVVKYWVGWEVVPRKYVVYTDFNRVPIGMVRPIAGPSLTGGGDSVACRSWHDGEECGRPRHQWDLSHQLLATICHNCHNCHGDGYPWLT